MARGNGATPVIDCNSHVYEPQGVWDAYVPPEYRVAVRSAFWHQVDPETGLQTAILNGKAAPAMNQGRIIRQAVWRPSLSLDDIGGMDPEIPHPINPGAQDPDARLRDMDAMGISQAVLFPTLFLEYLPAVENPDLARVLAAAYNDWVLDFSRADPDRLLPAAILPTQDVVFAIGEARRVAQRGFRAVVIRPAFFQGRFLNHPYHNPLWKELERLGLAAFLHPSPGSANPEWTSEGSYVDRVAGNLRIGHSVAGTVAPMMDSSMALVAFCYYGHLEEYPRLKIGFANAGASWVPLALEKVETRLALSQSVRDVSLEPERVWVDRGTSLAVFHGWESTVARLHDEFSPYAAFGSRYPFHDTAMPQEALERFRRYGVPGDAATRMMSGNAARFLGL